MILSGTVERESRERGESEKAGTKARVCSRTGGSTEAIYWPVSASVGQDDVSISWEGLATWQKGRFATPFELEG